MKKAALVKPVYQDSPQFCRYADSFLHKHKLVYRIRNLEDEFRLIRPEDDMMPYEGRAQRE